MARRRKNSADVLEALNGDITPAPPTLHAISLDALASLFTGQAGDPEQSTLEPLRELCRKGNPFPLIAAQWPDMVVSAEHEKRIFVENLQLAEQAAITKEMKDAIFATGNPVLRLDWWQYIILAGMFDISIGELFIAGATGVGKGASVSMGVNLWYDVHSEARIHLTGRDREHARRNIFGETVKWQARLKHPTAGSVNAEVIKETERRYIILLNPDVSSSTAGEAFSGAHGNTYYVFDECTAHPESFVANARRNAFKIVGLANPRTLFGWFRDGYKKVPFDKKIAIVPGDLRMRLCMSIGGLDCVNVRYQRLKVPVAPKDGLTIDPRIHVCPTS